MTFRPYVSEKSLKLSERSRSRRNGVRVKGRLNTANADLSDVGSEYHGKGDNTSEFDKQSRSSSNGAASRGVHSRLYELGNQRHAEKKRL